MIRALLALLVAHTNISLPSTFHSIGSNSWVLYGISNCEQQVYTQTSDHGVVERMYWFQRESYLSMYPKLHHTYTSKRHATLNGDDYFVDTWIEHNDKPGAHAENTADLIAFMKTLGYRAPAGINSGSDEQHVDVLLRRNREVLPATTASVRFVHLADARQRKEFMIIYTVPVPNGTSLKSIEAGLIREAEGGLRFKSPLVR